MASELVETRLEQIDSQVIAEIAKMTGASYDVALETYRFGMLLRSIALEELSKEEEAVHSKVRAILSNDAFARIALLLLIPILKAAYGPVAKFIVTAGRKL